MSQYDSQFEENLYQLRRDKLQQIADLVRAQSPALSDIAAKYPNTFAFTHTIPDLRLIGDPLDTEALAAAHIESSIAGRIMAIRVQGKAGFAQLQQSGQQLQLYVRKDDVGETAFALYKLLDLGDHIGVSGYLMRTRTGELTLHVTTITFLAKAMLALPDKYHGLEDIELRYRQRYVDLIMNSGAREIAASSPTPPTYLSSRPESASFADAVERPADPLAPATPLAPSATEPDTLNVRETFVKRAAILRAIRSFFDTRGYLEVETPMLHTIVGGATARPFNTHHNALDIPLSLRIAPELYLKRLVVGGLDRVYEINRNFRNEGVSTQHNPEFTMLEFYQAYANYHDLITLTKELIAQVAIDVNGTTITSFNGVDIDLAVDKWQSLSMREAIIKFWPEKTAIVRPTLNAFMSDEGMKSWAEEIGITTQIAHSEKARQSGSMPERQTDPAIAEFVAKTMSSSTGITYAVFHELRRFYAAEQSRGKTTANIFEAVAEPHLIQPTIIYDFPLAVSPLSKVKPNEPDWVERFEFYIGGFEVGNAFSELNDPDDQRNRFLAQLAERDRGDDEAMQMDEDYVRALGYGLPPTAGEGIGIDRLTMILTGSRSIRDVILFPLMRPQKPTPEPEAPHGESAE